MLEALMRSGSYRVDYLNVSARGKPEAFAFYVCGDLPHNAAYSATAKRSLYAGLSLIQQALGPENLVAIYLDVNSVKNITRPAYVQMKQDLRAGMFRRIFILQGNGLSAERESAADLDALYREVGGFDLLTYEQGAFKPVLLVSSGALA